MLDNFVDPFLFSSVLDSKRPACTTFYSLSIPPHQQTPTLNMVRLREIPRTATFAWSPGAASPLIATGTRAGAVDADFSNETCLELWDLALSNQDAGAELQPVAKIDTDSGYACIICLMAFSALFEYSLIRFSEFRFNDLAWTESDDHKRGIIAGGLESGSLDLWDADKLLSGARLVTGEINHANGGY